MNKILLSILIIFSIIVFQSCEEPVRTILTKEEKVLLDSLYAKRVSGVRKRADSICIAQYQSIFDAARDSFYMNELREIEAIINGER